MASPSRCGGGRDCSGWPVWTLHLGAVMLLDHDLARHATIMVADCAGSPLIPPRANFANRLQIDELPGVGGGLRHEAGSMELMKVIALRGLGLAFITRVGVEAELKESGLCMCLYAKAMGWFEAG
ncbi:LysR substrate-binding domain-containing protein [Pseudoroseomonas globiformis]|uniref:LysR substrate-binding domain-containing protein n=1 Tax=Teichococcus globiformis TaxID=2307229 RepID=A0ABV7FYR5_9PROT